jgi:hypothetical protein
MVPISIALIFLCTTISSRGGHTTEEHVDLVELNHFFDQQGRLVYDQVIFYERAPETGRFQVRAWCLVEDRESLNRRPVKNETTGLYQVDWFDADQRLLRRITSSLYRESWTQLDPERANKKVHDERLRISMVQNPKKFLPVQSIELDEPKPAALVTTTRPSAEALVAR